MPKALYLIDANVFLRVLVKEDAKAFTACRKFLTGMKQGKIKAFTPGLVLAEVVWTLTSYYQFSREKTAQGVQSIIGLENLRVIDDCQPSLAVKYFQETKVKFIDAMLGSSKRIQAGKAVIVSYDRDFDKLGVKRMEPGEIRG